MSVPTRNTVLLLAWLAACNSNADQNPPPARSCENPAASTLADGTCGRSSDCDLGFYCVDGCCIEDPCANGDPSSCGYVPASDCGVEFECACQFAGALGALAVDDQAIPVIEVVPATTLDLLPTLSEIATSTSHGRLLPTSAADYSFDLPAGDLSFSLAGTGAVVATDVASAAPTRVTATLSGDPTVVCQLDLVNLGNAAAAGQVRIRAIDSMTGEPLESVRLVIDVAGVGVAGEDDGWGGAGGATDASGLATSAALPPGSSFAVSAFLPGYDYLTLVGLPLDMTDLILPLQPREAERPVGGYFGTIDFAGYELGLLGGLPRPLRFGWAGVSFPLLDLLAFDLKPVFGRRTTGCGTPQQVGRCQDVTVAGSDLINQPFDDRLVAGLGTQDWKPFFDVQGRPGRRTAWLLGGELAPADLALPVREYADGNWAYLSNGDRFRGVGTVLHRLAIGESVFVSMPPASRQAWEEQVLVDYPQRTGAAANPLFARLDDSADADQPSLGLVSPLDQIGRFDLASLPRDPNQGAGDATLDGVMVLRGVRNDATGLTLTGLGVGLDCTRGSCDDRAQHLCTDGQICDPAGPACGDGSSCLPTFDGVIDGGLLCDYSTVAADNECSPQLLAVAPEGRLADGSVALFYSDRALATSVGEPVTVTMAMSLHAGPGEPLRGTARVEREPSPATSRALGAGDFLPVPTLVAPTGRSLMPAASVVHDLQRIVFTSEANDWGESSPSRWTVYFVGAAGEPFVAPVPQDAAGNPLPDPVAPSPDTDVADPGETIPTGHVRVHQADIDLAPGHSLANLAAANGTTLQHLSGAIDAFACNGGDLLVQ